MFWTNSLSKREKARILSFECFVKNVEGPFQNNQIYQDGVFEGNFAISLSNDLIMI